MSEHEYCTDVLYDKYVVTEISLKIQGFVSTESIEEEEDSQEQSALGTRHEYVHVCLATNKNSWTVVASRGLRTVWYDRPSRDPGSLRKMQMERVIDQERWSEPIKAVSVEQVRYLTTV
uniref:Uncharacterized protein n=1 Tax=Vespula pensylvanica TaxID=30213 RepID=A0A834P7F2_VESPE|nr:hypothetical protein H0235_004397 [Vespula pensylvanica]